MNSFYKLCAVMLGGSLVSGALSGVSARAGADASAATPIAGHDDSETHYSPLQSINADNVGRLGLAWSYDLDTRRGQEATPIVVDGVLYTSTAWSKVLAFDAASGKLLWAFDPKVPGATAIHACCDVVNRGVALWHRRVYVATLDGRLIALDAHDGKPIWSVSTIDASRPYTISGAPLIVGKRVIIGNAGAEYGVRGYVSAYDADSGRLDWRFYTVPGDPAKGFESPEMARAAKTWSGQWWLDGGGGTVWNAFSYDSALDLLYFGTGNASPWGRKESSPTPLDNLYASSIVAVHASTGRYAWHFQTTPGDHWDYDADQNLTLATVSIKGKPRQVVMQAAKNGYFYVLDRRSGELLSADNFVPVNWTTGLDPKTGRPAINAAAKYYESGKVWVSQPGALGGHSWQAMAYSPRTSLVYIPAQEVGQPYLHDPAFKRQPVGMNNELDMATTSLPDDPSVQQAVMATLKGYLSAWDPATRRERWRVEHKGPWNGGLLATAGDLVFQGTATGELQAFDARSGRKLWAYAAQSGVLAAPMTYSINGRQYVAVMVGWGGVYPLVAGELSFKSGHQVNRSRLLVFALDAKGALPAPALTPVPVISAPTTPVDAQQAASGARLYTRDCSSCHGDAAIAGGVVPDLRLSAALANDDFWRTVVEDGALSSEGMIGFKSVLSTGDIRDIRAYLIQRAQAAAARH
jgi:alcohol dehydrogenase (cytochrome c)/quinohemoprotein ethanol dehydrogenase